MTRVLFAVVALVLASAALTGCRAEIEADDATSVSAPR